MMSLFEHLATAAETDGTFGVSLVTQPGGLMDLYDEVGLPATEHG